MQQKWSLNYQYDNANLITLPLHQATVVEYAVMSGCDGTAITDIPAVLPSANNAVYLWQARRSAASCGIWHRRHGTVRRSRLSTGLHRYFSLFLCPNFPVKVYKYFSSLNKRSQACHYKSDIHCYIMSQAINEILTVLKIIVFLLSFLESWVFICYFLWNYLYYNYYVQVIYEFCNLYYYYCKIIGKFYIYYKTCHFISDDILTNKWLQPTATCPCAVHILCKYFY